MALLFLTLVCLISLVPEGVSLVNVNRKMKSFSYAIKNGVLMANIEKTLYEHNTGQTGVITEQWFTGALDESTTIKIYIDGETEASLDFNLFLAHGIGFGGKYEKQNTPWGTRRLGHAANNGAIYNTFRIPFGKSFRVTASRPVGSAVIWYIVRGVENYPLVLGDLILPSNARLRLYKNVDVNLEPLEFLPLAYTKSSAGALFMVTMVANSSNLVYLEGCMRAYIDDSNNTTWLSSGTEDFFLSAFYFNRGVYQQDNAGLTYLNETKGSFSAYKFFENDPVLFGKSFELWWRCSDFDTTTDMLGCPETFPDPYSDTEKYFGREKRFSEMEKSFGRNHKKDSNTERFSGKEFLPPNTKFGVPGESPSMLLKMMSTRVTTYTWVYEW